MDGQRIGSRYVLETLVGHGACGQVWVGRDLEGHEWAVKVLRSELATDPGLVNRFVAERSLLEAVRHPHVVPVHDLVVEGSTLAVIMSLVHGTDLRHVLRQRGPIVPAGVAEWGAQIAGALQAAHDAGVIHRDVKPENVLVDEATEAAMLTDFGIARLIDGATHSTMMLGTPQYMAPEIAEGRAPGPAADLYSLGVMLYELCCGVPPFAGRGSAMATLRAHLEEIPGRPAGVPDALWDVVATLVAKDPEARGGTAGRIEARLRALVPMLEGLPPAARIADPPPAERHLTYAPPVDAEVAQQTSRWAGPAVSGPGWAGSVSGQAPATWAGVPGQVAPPGYVAAYPATPQYAAAPYAAPQYAAAPYPVPPQPAQTSRKPVSPLLVGLAAVALVCAGVVGAVTLSDGRGSEEASASPTASAVAAAPSPAAGGASPAAPAGQAAAVPSGDARGGAAQAGGAAPQPAAAPAAPAAPAAAPRRETVPSFTPPPRTVAQQQPREEVDAVARQRSAEQMLSEYFVQAEGGTLGDEAAVAFLAPTVSWYDKGTLSRVEVVSATRGEPGKPRTSFWTNRVESFTPAVSYGGHEADVIVLNRSYRRPSGTGGDIRVTYTLVYDREGQSPRIAQVREQRL